MKATTHLLNQSPSKVALLAIAPVAVVRVDGASSRLRISPGIACERRPPARGVHGRYRRPALQIVLQQGAFGLAARQSVLRLAVAAIGGLISLSALSQVYAPVAHIALDHLALWARGKLQWLLEVGPDWVNAD